MKLTKTFILAIVTALFSGIAAGGIIAINRSNPVFSEGNKFCVILDAGHGAID